MLTAYLYIRVSTDEQAVKGYSQRSQTDRLVKYCKHNHISIAEAIYEDYSAKTFNRPEWNKLYNKLKLIRTQFPIILFTHWDRFSRNITDAYSMLDRLHKMNVLLQAIEQPIDFSVPESKIILAMYLATSEVENDRRSANVRLGMRKAKLEGRWVHKAPIGYKNITSSDGQKFIIPQEPEASIISNAFESIAREKGYIRDVYRQAITKGLKCSESTFYQLLRNPIYCGKIYIPQFGEEKSRVVEGIHKKIISIILFDQVQKILNDHRNKLKPKIQRTTINEDLILRGVLLCPNCGKTLTGSASKGRLKRYYYYHCAHGCTFRVRADFVNQQFLVMIKSLKANKPFIELYNKILKETYVYIHKEYFLKKSQINKEMSRIIDRSLNAQQLFTNGEIDYEDYLLIRNNCKAHLNNDAKQLQELALNMVAQTYSKDCPCLLNRLGWLYEENEIYVKQQIITLLIHQKVILNINDLRGLLSIPARVVFGLENHNENRAEKVPKEDNDIRKFLESLVLLDFQLKSSIL